MRCEILRHDRSHRVPPPHGVIESTEFGVLRTWRAGTWPTLMGLLPSRCSAMTGELGA